MARVIPDAEGERESILLVSHWKKTGFPLLATLGRE